MFNLFVQLVMADYSFMQTVYQLCWSSLTVARPPHLLPNRPTREIRYDITGNWTVLWWEFFQYANACLAYFHDSLVACWAWTTFWRYLEKLTETDLSPVLCLKENGEPSSSPSHLDIGPVSTFRAGSLPNVNTPLNSSSSIDLQVTITLSVI